MTIKSFNAMYLISIASSRGVESILERNQYLIYKYMYASTNIK